MGDLIRKSDVLEAYADLYDIFDDNKAIQEELHKVFDKINDIPPVEPNCSEKPNNCDTCRFDDRYGEESICLGCSRYYSDCYAPKEYKEGTIIGCYLDRHFIEKANAERTEPQTVLNDYSKADDCMECEKFFDCDAPDEVKHASRVTDCAWGKGEDYE